MIPRDSKFCEFSFQTLAEGTVVPSIVGSNTKQFVGDPIFAQDFQDNAGHIFAGVVLTETFKAHDLLMKLEIVIDPLTNNSYSVSRVIVCETGIEKINARGGFFPFHRQSSQIPIWETYLRTPCFQPSNAMHLMPNSFCCQSLPLDL